MSIPIVNHDGSAEPVSDLLALGLTQLSIQITLSTSLTASALGLATLATALTSTILTFAAAVAGAGYLRTDDVIVAYEVAANYPEDVGITVLGELPRRIPSQARVSLVAMWIPVRDDGTPGKFRPSFDAL